MAPDRERYYQEEFPYNQHDVRPSREERRQDRFPEWDPYRMISRHRERFGSEPDYQASRPAGFRAKRFRIPYGARIREEPMVRRERGELHSSFPGEGADFSRAGEGIQEQKGGYGGYGLSGDYGEGYSEYSRFGYGSRPGFYGERDYDDATRYEEPLPEEQSNAQTTASKGRYYGVRAKPFKRSRFELTEEISEALARDARIDASEIEVNVNDEGEVTLTGVVESRMVKKMCVQLCESLAGVTEVHNKLVIKGHESQSKSWSLFG
ncbi:MAG: BON domain-containing protein [Deltaproteobacteria bacterium]|nr:BON domain-containing protein [Deltaproteobacteria bacterium]